MCMRRILKPFVTFEEDCTGVFPLRPFFLALERRDPISSFSFEQWVSPARVSAFL